MHLVRSLSTNSTKVILDDVRYDPKSKVVEVEDGEDDLGDDLGDVLELVVEVEMEEGIGVKANLFC